MRKTYKRLLQEAQKNYTITFCSARNCGGHIIKKGGESLNRNDWKIIEKLEKRYFKLRCLPYFSTREEMTISREKGVDGRWQCHHKPTGKLIYTKYNFHDLELLQQILPVKDILGYCDWCDYSSNENEDNN